MESRKSTNAILLFASAIALSYGIAQLSRLVSRPAETVDLLQIRPVSGNIYPSRGELAQGDPADIDAAGREVGGTGNILTSSCGPDKPGRVDYRTQRIGETCSILRSVDPRLNSLEYLRAAPEPSVPLKVPK